MTDEDEYCMCGSLISAHGMWENHSPVPESHYREEKEYADQSERDSMNTAGEHSEDRDD